MDGCREKKHFGVKVEGVTDIHNEQLALLQRVCLQQSCNHIVERGQRETTGETIAAVPRDLALFFVSCTRVKKLSEE